MKASDKIYLYREQPKDYFDENWHELPASDVENIEYIRKDALLEWLQNEYKTNAWFYETHAKPNAVHSTRCETYKRVIEKIESL